MEFSVHRPSPLNTYSYVREEYLGSTRKSVEIYLLFTFVTILILAIHTQRVKGLDGGTFLRQRKKTSSSPREAGVCCPSTLRRFLGFGIVTSLCGKS